MSKSYVAKAIARALYESEGFISITIPSGVESPDEMTRQIVDELNFLVPGSLPYALEIIDESVELSDETFERLEDESSSLKTTSQAIKYRTPPKRAIVTSSQSTLLSISGVFVPAVEWSFPGTVSDAYLNLEKLAYSSIDVCLIELGIDPGKVDDRSRRRLSSVFTLLKNTYESYGSTSSSWNGLLLRHIEVGLKELVDRLDRIEVSAPLEETLFNCVFPSFAMPNPKRGDSYSGSNLYEKAVEKYWSTASLISSSIASIERKESSRGLCSLSQIKWDDFDETLTSSSKGNPMLALILHEKSTGLKCESFLGISEDDFFAPSTVSVVDPTIVDLDGFSLNLPEISARLFFVTVSRDDEGYSSDEVEIFFPVSGTVSQEEIDQSSPTLIVTGRSVSFVALEKSATLDPLGISIRGRFLVTANTGIPDVEWTRKISLSLDNDDPLFGSIPSNAQVTVTLLNSDWDSYAFGKSSGKLEWVGVKLANQAATEDPAIFYESKNEYSLICFSSSNSKDIRLNETRLTSAPKQRDLSYLKSLKPKETDSLNFLTESVKFYETSESSISVMTPLGAAVRGEAYNFTTITGKLTRTLRGQVENFFRQKQAVPAFIEALGHVVLTSELQESFEKIDSSPKGSYLAGEEFLKRWAVSGLHDIPDDFLNSKEVEDFRRAFLDLLEEVYANPANHGLRNQAWPSQLSYRGVANSPTLSRYLESFSSMVEFSKTYEDPSVNLWAAYPFAVSVWSPIHGGTLEAVLLSPWHPIRLSWLASVESALSSAESATALAGSVEGWNFPFFGPSHSKPGRMIAVPADSDIQQVFTGWSTLVTASIAGHEPLKVPERAGGLPLPGVSTTGLNSNAVRNSITSFRRTRPYLSTLTFDLAATSPAPKIAEIDSTVLSEAVDFLTQRANVGLVSGIRIYDSLNREGTIPEIRVDAVKSSAPTPITWRRYDDSRESVKANVRILQDSGVLVQVQENSTELFGVVGPIPFRRFEIPQKFEAGPANSVHYSPSLGSGEGGCFARAVKAVECNEQMGTTAKVRISNSSPLLGSADWTVSGESMVAPSALSEILKNAPNSDSMLWEWNPPILSKASKMNETPIDQRPYFSIATIPTVFRNSLRTKLSLLHGHQVDDEEISNLLTLLGSRGIGLSNLISAGGSQFTGALGFYTLLRLMENLKESVKGIFVIPIDVSENFLSSIAKADEELSSGKRADLLMIQLFDLEVVLSPIEIKFYNIENPQTTLPPVGSHLLQEPREQLESTCEVLKKIADNLNDSSSQHSGADRFLMWNAFATMIEAGMRLDPQGDSDRGNLVEKLQSIVNGTSKIRLGSPIVAYFSKTQNGSRPVHSSVDGVNPRTLEFIADPTVVLKDLESHGTDSEILGIWRGLVLNSMEGGGDRAITHQNKTELDVTIDTRSDEPKDQCGTPSNGECDSREDFEKEVAHGSHVDSEQEKLLDQTESELSSETQSEGVRFSVGELLDSRTTTSVDFWPGNTELNQLNIGVVGDLGTGKTQLLQSLIYQLRSSATQSQDNEVSFLVFDYKRDYQGEEFKTAAGVTVLNPDSMPLNIFHIEGEKTQHNVFQKAKSFVDVISKIYSNVGPKQRSLLTKIVIKLITENEIVTFEDVCREYLALTNAPDSVSAILENFSLGGIFSSDRESLRPLRELLNNRVLVVNLSALGADQETKNAIVALMLNQYFDYMITLPKWPFGSGPIKTRRLNSFLLVDEATNIMQFGFPVLSQILLQGREFGVGVLLSSQYLSHFDDGGTNYAEPLRTWFIHRVPSVTTRELSRIGNIAPTEQIVHQIQNLQPHQAFYVSYGWNGRFIRGRAFFEIMQSLN